MKHEPLLADSTLALAADVVDDLERVRIANENRLRTLTSFAEHGHALTVDHPDVLRLASVVAGLVDLEHQAILNLGRIMRHHPFGPWMKQRPGVGQKQLARLLAAIRDPYWNDLHDRPRTLRELYAYCGFHVLGVAHCAPDSQIHCGDANETNPTAHSRSDDHQSHSGGAHHDVTTHDQDDSQGAVGGDDTAAQSLDATHAAVGGGVAPKHKRGERANWNSTARMRLWLIADKCVQTLNSPYREIYDAGRIKYADATHNAACAQCGPKGKPAPAGTPLSLGHQHARARRLIAKAILRDLWSEAKRLHELNASTRNAA